MKYLPVLNRYVLLVSFLFGLSFTYAQVVQTDRYELEQRYSDEEFTLIPLEEDGLVLFRKTSRFSDNKRIWELIHLDTALSEKKTLELILQDRDNLTGYEHSDGFIHLLFFKDAVRGSMEIISINLKTYHFDSHKIQTELAINLTHFNKCNNNFILGGTVGAEAAMLVYNPSLGSLKIIPGFFSKSTELVDVQINENQTFNVILLNHEDRVENKILFKIFDSNGKLLVEDQISIPKHRLQTAISSKLKRDDLMIIGTWGGQKARQSYGRTISEIF